MAHWVTSYRPEWLRPDLVAGLSLAAFAIPESLAYASLAGVPPQAGLYCYLLGGLGYALLGSSRQLAMGPTSAISILVAASLLPLAGGDPARHASLAALTAALVGAVAFAAWLLRLGGVVSFVSEPVLSGFKLGAGLVIASSQLPKLFGIHSGGSNFFERIANLAVHLGDVHATSLAVGLSALLLLAAGERWLRHRPVVLIVVAFAIVASILLGLAERGVAVVGALPEGLPALGLQGVSRSDAGALVPLAIACFLLAYVEGSSTARSFALAHRTDVRPDRELLGLGLANLAVGLGQGFPVAGGMSQSAVNEKAGARTPLALVVASAAVAGVLLFLSGAFQALPEPVLAALVLMAVAGLVDPAPLREIRRVDRIEFRAGLVAVLGVLLLGILQGVLVAAIFSLAMLIRRAASPRMAVMGRIPGSARFGDLERHPDAQPVPGILVLGVYSAIVYFSAENVRSEVLRRVRKADRPELVVLDLVGSPMDLTGLRMVGRLQDELAADGIALRIAEVQGAARDLVRGEGAGRQLGPIDRRYGAAEVIAAWRAERTAAA